MAANNTEIPSVKKWDGFQKIAKSDNPAMMDQMTAQTKLILFISSFV